VKIVITDDRFGNNAEEERVFSGLGAELIVADCHTEDEAIRACEDADGVLLNQAPMPGRVVRSLKRCKVISRYGIGYDNVDAPAAAERGIWVTNVPDYCIEEVAEHALGLLLACVRGIPYKDRGVRSGKWDLRLPIRRITGSVLGILGFGATGRAFWEKVQGLGFGRILINDPRLAQKLHPGMFGSPAAFEELIQESDYISLHIPLNERTRGFVNRQAFSRMKDGAILINTSRGGVLDEEALVEALEQRRIAAGLDVFEREPLGRDHPLTRLDNVVLTDHSAYYSRESVSKLKTLSAQNVRDVLEGRIPRTPVNRPAAVSEG
jgi:D-3-phosphoglycerate dehydrogenase